jgi:hypothetical protein
LPLCSVGQLLPDCTAQYPENSHLHTRYLENLKSVLVTRLLSIPHATFSLRCKYSPLSLFLTMAHTNFKSNSDSFLKHVLPNVPTHIIYCQGFGFEDPTSRCPLALLLLSTVSHFIRLQGDTLARGRNTRGCAAARTSTRARFSLSLYLSVTGAATPHRQETG